jgi:hypothetical protein
MRFYPKGYLGALAVVLMAMPVWAGKDAAHKDTTNLDIAQPTTVGTTQLQPGHYTVQATEGQNQFDILREGKVVATVPCQWIKLPSKATGSTVSTDDGKINGINFEGRDQAIKIG